MMGKWVYMSLILMLVSEISVADYFDTNRSQKIFGIYLTDSSQIDEIHSHSNAFGFSPQSAEEITEYLDANKNGLLPVIRINHLLLNKEKGLYHHSVKKIIRAIEKSNTNNQEILFLMDEPLWTIRGECRQRNKLAACTDISNQYIQTLDTLRKAGQKLRKRFPRSGVMHIEAWAELAIQKKTYPNDNVIMLDDAEYLGFDCYGDIEFCGSQDDGHRHQAEYATWVWDVMQAMESRHSINRKLFLVPGTFLADGHFDDVDTVLKQMEFYAWALQLSDKIGGFGAFLWGDMIENGRYFTGARNIHAVANLLALIAEYYDIKNDR